MLSKQTLSTLNSFVVPADKWERCVYRPVPLYFTEISTRQLPLLLRKGLIVPILLADRNSGYYFLTSLGWQWLECYGDE